MRGFQAHLPPPATTQSFAKRVDIWHQRTKGTRFLHSDFQQLMDMAEPRSIIYCDPPYTHTQAILYGAHRFSLPRLFETISTCKERGVRVALSIDGSKKSGDLLCDIPVPRHLFKREVMVNCGRSMLRRFQRGGETLEDEVVKDRLLLTY